MIKPLLALLTLCTLLCTNINAQTVKIIYNKNIPQAAYAFKNIQEELKKKGYTISNGAAEYEINLAVDSTTLGAEAYTLKVRDKKITITGGDNRGMIYGALSLAEDVSNKVGLQNIKEKEEKPHYALRAIKFDLPWDTYRHSYALDLHQQTCSDVAYWEAFLDMMAKNRFNSLTLWNLHPYPYLIKSKNFPEASPFTDAEMIGWKNLFGSIIKMAKDRAIDTYLFPFNIFVTPEFSKAHNVAMDNLDHHFFVNGDTSEIVKRYTRESVTQVLQEYPDLTGFGLTLGEGMAGMTPQQRENWMRETIIEGMRLAGRKSKLVHRIPFSSTTGSLGPTSIETEKLTRKAIEEEGSMEFIDGPVWADLKYNWSHAHSTPTLVKVHGGKLYDTYFSPEPKTYKVTWTARNEDFFCLRWGVPDFVRAHIAENNQSYVGGYFVGSETYIPAKDYFTKLTSPVSWKYAFERQWLFYKIWGRLLYNPATPDAAFNNEFVRRYGKAAAPLSEAYALASSTPLRLASDFDFTWDFTLYSEGFMALDKTKKVVRYISADWLIEQPTTDPNYVRIADYVTDLASGKSFEASKVTPPILAKRLEDDCNKALALVKNISVANNTSLMYEVADVKAWANLGLHFAEKIKGATALHTYRLYGGTANQKKAIQHFQNALKYWDAVIAITKPIYKEMPLVHYSEQNGKHWKENDHLRFHWANLRKDVAQDIEIAKKATPAK